MRASSEHGGFFVFSPINLALTMTTGGWCLPESNGGFIIVMVKTFPMALMMKCCFSFLPIIFISSGKHVQTEYAEFKCCRWRVPFGGNKGCELRRNTSILCGQSRHNVKPIIKHSGSVYGDVKTQITEY